MLVKSGELKKHVVGYFVVVVVGWLILGFCHMVAVASRGVLVEIPRALKIEHS